VAVEAVAVGLLDAALEWAYVGVHFFYHEGHEGNEGLKDETFQAAFQDFHIEIDQKALFYFGEFHICHQLGFMNRFQLGHGFQFHDDGIFDGSSKKSSEFFKAHFNIS